VTSPDEALQILGRALRICPELQVVGVAGPGDPLASGHALETLTRAHELYPELLTCLSTNGLALGEYLPLLIGGAGLKTITVTVNAVNPQILSRLCAGIVWRGRLLEGRQAGERLINAQMEGIQSARISGLFVKVNMVLVAGVNDRHVEEVARSVASWGASFINIIPLLPAAEFAGAAPPSGEMIERAIAGAERFIAVMRHCRRCRADACGIPGVSDFAPELYGNFRQLDTFSHG
jgi:nitrogen fixation protein NifB